MLVLLLLVVLVVLYKAWEGLPKVHRPTPEQQVTLNILKDRIHKLLAYLEMHDDPMLATLKTRLRARPPKLVHTSDRAGFSQNKGEIVGICLTEAADKNNSSEYINNLFYVLIHELAHIGAEEYGHTDKFWVLFSSLRQHAQDANLLSIVDRDSAVCGQPLT